MDIRFPRRESLDENAMERSKLAETREVERDLELAIMIFGLGKICSRRNIAILASTDYIFHIDLT